MIGNVYDVIIIGGGPAGLAAGIYCARAKRQVLLLEKDQYGGRAYTTREIVNYPGFARTTGPELGETLRSQAAGMGVEFKREAVRSVELAGLIKSVKTRKNEYQTKTLIIATGTSPRILGIPGERELAGRGVAYCATCDGEFFKDEKIAVLGSGDQAIEESIYLSRFVSHIDVIVMHDEGILDCNKASAELAYQNEKINFIFNSTIDSINGEDEVEGVTLKNIKDGTKKGLDVKGVFMFVGMVPNSALFAEKLANRRGWLLTDETMETNLAGVYAVGDVREKYLRQVVTSCADGAIAAVAADRYLQEMEIVESKLSSFEEVVLVFYDSRNKQSTDKLMEMGLNDENVISVDVAVMKNLAKQYNISLDDEAVKTISITRN